MQKRIWVRAPLLTPLRCSAMLFPRRVARIVLSIGASQLDTIATLVNADAESSKKIINIAY